MSFFYPQDFSPPPYSPTHRLIKPLQLASTYPINTIALFHTQDNQDAALFSSSSFFTR